MVSRSECDEAFRLIGYPKFVRRNNSEIFQRVNETEELYKEYSDFYLIENPDQDLTLDSNPKFCILDDESRLLLINAQRCNAICSDIDSKKTCDEKLQLAFDRVQSVELSNIFPELCLYLIRVDIGTLSIIIEPVDPISNWYKNILSRTKKEYLLIELIHKYGFWFYTHAHFPTNVNVWKIKYLVDFETEKGICEIKKSFEK